MTTPTSPPPATTSSVGELAAARAAQARDTGVDGLVCSAEEAANLRGIYDGTVAPPAGPGGAKYYDDNDWVGIELMRVYKHDARTRPCSAAPRAIMAFEMAGWQGSPELGCPGGIPFSNQLENTDRNTITTAPAAELAVQLYRATDNPQYLQFADTGLRMGAHVPAAAERPVRRPHQPARRRRTAPLELHPGRDDRRRHAALPGDRQRRPTSTRRGRPPRPRSPTSRRERLGAENPFFPSVYFRNLLYLDSVTHDPPGPKIAQAYVDYAWQHLRLANNLFVAGSPPLGQLLVQAAIVQIYALLVLAAEHLLLAAPAAGRLGRASE